jgi:hypothetical protein
MSESRPLSASRDWREETPPAALETGPSPAQQIWAKERTKWKKLADEKTEKIRFKKQQEEWMAEAKRTAAINRHKAIKIPKAAGYGANPTAEPSAFGQQVSGKTRAADVGMHWRDPGPTPECLKTPAPSAYAADISSMGKQALSTTASRPTVGFTKDTRKPLNWDEKTPAPNAYANANVSSMGRQALSQAASAPSVGLSFRTAGNLSYDGGPGGPGVCRDDTAFGKPAAPNQHQAPVFSLGKRLASDWQKQGDAGPDAGPTYDFDEGFRPQVRSTLQSAPQFSLGAAFDHGSIYNVMRRQADTAGPGRCREDSSFLPQEQAAAAHRLASGQQTGDPRTEVAPERAPLSRVKGHRFTGRADYAADKVESDQAPAPGHYLAQHGGLTEGLGGAHCESRQESVPQWSFPPPKGSSARMFVPLLTAGAELTPGPGGYHQTELFDARAQMEELLAAAAARKRAQRVEGEVQRAVSKGGRRAGEAALAEAEAEARAEAEEQGGAGGAKEAMRARVRAKAEQIASMGPQADSTRPSRPMVSFPVTNHYPPPVDQGRHGPGPAGYYGPAFESSGTQQVSTKPSAPQYTLHGRTFFGSTEQAQGGMLTGPGPARFSHQHAAPLSHTVVAPAHSMGVVLGERANKPWALPLEGHSAGPGYFDPHMSSMGKLPASGFRGGGHLASAPAYSMPGRNAKEARFDGGDSAGDLLGHKDIADMEHSIKRVQGQEWDKRSKQRKAQSAFGSQVESHMRTCGGRSFGVAQMAAVAGMATGPQDPLLKQPPDRFAVPKEAAATPGPGAYTNSYF